MTVTMWKSYMWTTGKETNICFKGSLYLYYLIVFNSLRQKLLGIGDFPKMSKMFARSMYMYLDLSPNLQSSLQSDNLSH